MVSAAESFGSPEERNSSPEQHDYQGHSMSHHDGATQPGIEKLILQPRWLDRGLTTTDLILRNRHTLLYLKTFPDEVYLESLIEMPCLRHLHLEHAESNQWLILDLLMVCPSLQILHLNSLSGKSEEGEEGFSVPLPYLQKIYLNDCSCLGSSFFHSLDNLNALTEVSMYGCHSITEQGRKALLAKAPNLKTIHYYPWKDKSSPSDHYLLGPAQMGRTIQWEL
ncbi:hypothetical protein BCR43DRAFT_67145 [Syncephalastrum racemosum]|uniref:F-box domain-containing protein n=1 Tax=Syncephalastrum racemosum TaxID=13706 RepID=A0A1X2HXU1_SYNRA|nr:hypothetical protein BCR43DRAFT_67145 [Syncephalastrum racemosum]